MSFGKHSAEEQVNGMVGNSGNVAEVKTFKEIRMAFFDEKGKKVWGDSGLQRKDSKR